MTRALSALLLASTATACIPPYKPPRADQPHAVIKLRRSYEATGGTHLREAVDVDGHYLLRETSISAVAKAPLTDSFLAHPVPSTFVVQSEFYHQEVQMVSETYQEPHTTYRTEWYDCSSGFGSTATHRTCTRSVSDTTYETRYRIVPRTVEVSDGSCARQLRFAPQDQHVYLLQYTYQAPDVCRLVCFEQVSLPDGSFENRRCPAPPPVAEE